MSLFVPMTVNCPGCGALVTMDAVGSVNADRRPDYRDAIIGNVFQEVECGECGETFRLQPEFNYLDAGRGQWIASLPADRLRAHLAVEDESKALFDRSYGPDAPAAAQAVGRTLDMRVTFGWPALREKLVARAAGLDDTVLEMLKLDLLRRLPEAPLREGVELRLAAAGEHVLTFVWVTSETEDVLGEFAARRELYDAIADNQPDWAPVRARLADGPFVDIQKLFMGEGRA